MAKSVIFSGMQPTGPLHIGNYLGALKNWVSLQNSGKYDCYFCIVDYHTLSGDMTPEERRKNILLMASEFIAAGIDPKKSTIFVQSHIPEHTELAWVFNTVTPVAELERMTQFKDKSAKQSKNINAGLFDYPVLQAADILLYKGTHVPVGKDQVQHVELTRDIARWFNKRYKKYFPETKTLLTEVSKVMSLLDPEKKMSKSWGNNHVIDLADEPDVIVKKLKKAVTASEGGNSSAGVENLLRLLKHFAPAGKYDHFFVAEKDGSIRYGDLKKELASEIGMYFEDFRIRRAELMNGHDEVAVILADGAKRASEVAEETMRDVREIVGVR